MPLSFLPFCLMVVLKDPRIITCDDFFYKKWESVSNKSRSSWHVSALRDFSSSVNTLGTSFAHTLSDARLFVTITIFGMANACVIRTFKQRSEFKSSVTRVTFSLVVVVDGIIVGA